MCCNEIKWELFMEDLVDLLLALTFYFVKMDIIGMDSENVQQDQVYVMVMVE